MITGPDCQPWTPLAAGRHSIGRAPLASIRLRDPLVEAHHALIDVDATGSTEFIQLTGRIPVDDGESLVLGSSRVDLRARSCFEVVTGGTVAPARADPWRLEVRRGVAPAPAEVTAAPKLPQPAATFDRPSATGLIGAFVGVAGAAAMTVLIGQVMFALFAMFGAVASFATWLAGVIGAARRQRRATAAAAASLDTFVVETAQRHAQLLARHRSVHPDIVEALGELRGAHHRLWRDRPATGELVAVLGRGSLVARIDTDITAECVNPEVLAVLQQHREFLDVPVPITLRPADTVALHGPSDAVVPLARSLLVQLATWVGPADLRLIIASANPARWSWVAWLPHALDGTGEAMVLDTKDLGRLALLDDADVGDDPGAHRATVVLIDDPAPLTVRTGPLRRFMSATKAITVLLVDAPASVPAVCRRTLSVSGAGRAAWVGQTVDAFDIVGLQVAGVGEETAWRSARRLAPMLDPEDSESSTSHLPGSIALSDLDGAVVGAARGRGADDIARRWREAGSDPSLRAPIGRSVDGVVEVDLVADGPHALIAGTTGSGKSELLRTLVVSMASRVSPDHLTFMLVDYKGGSTFDCCVDLPHTVGVVTDLDDGLAERALVSLEAELNRRERAFRASGVGDLTAYRLQENIEPMPRLVVVIDEFATLARDLPDFLAALVGIAQRGRSLGIHLVLATQRPSGVINDDIRTNTNLRLALRVTDRADAGDVVGDDAPARFSRAHPGRAAIRLGPDELIVFQTAHSSGPLVALDNRLRATTIADLPSVSRASSVTAATSTTTELAAAVATIRQAVGVVGTAAPRRPWLDPLPATLDPLLDVLDSCELEHGQVDNVSATTGIDATCTIDDAVGLIDDPANQTRVPLRWDTTAGNLMLVGALGSGLSSTVIRLAAALGRCSTALTCHAYVIDGLGNPALDAVGSMEHCGGVIRVGEHERIDRLLRRLIAEIDRRQVGLAATGDVRVVLFVDGLSELRRSLDSIERLTSLAMLDRILDAGPAVGVVSCITTDGTSGGSNAAAAERWVFHVDDTATARAAGLRGAVVSDEHPGRLRIASSGLEAQVASADRITARRSGRTAVSRPAVIATLPVDVDPTTLPHSQVVATTSRPIRHLVLGVSSDDLAPAVLALADGDHLFVGGSARAGKSSALDQLARAWSQIDGPGSVVRWGDLPAPELAERLEVDDGRSTLLVVDDADRVTDSDGMIAAVLEGTVPRVTIAAAARMEAVRSAYGHWTREITRSRCGLVLTSFGEIDGELLGVTLPRRMSIPPRPGLAWLIDGQGHRLVQVAGRLPP